MQREVSFLYGGFFDIGKSVSGQSEGARPQEEKGCVDMKGRIFEK